MINKLLIKLGYTQVKPDLVQLCIDDVEVISEALSIYQARLPCKQYGYFSEAASNAKAKILALRSDLFSQFTQLG